MLFVWFLHWNLDARGMFRGTLCCGCDSQLSLAKVSIFNWVEEFAMALKYDRVLDLVGLSVLNSIASTSIAVVSLVSQDGYEGLLPFNFGNNPNS
jgi:hypothetical protein